MAGGEITEKKGGQIEALLNEMKNEGIGGGLIRKDNVVIKTTMALSEIAPGLIARTSNISEALMEKVKNTHKEAEISFANGTLVSIPMKNYIFFGIAKTKEEKKRIIEYAKKATSVI